MEDDRSNVNVKVVNHFTIIELIISLTFQDCKGNTALHVAVLCQHVDIVRMMLQCPRFTEKKALNSRNLTAEMMAKSGRSKKSKAIKKLFE